MVVALALLIASTAAAQPRDTLPPRRPPRIRVDPPTVGPAYPPAIVRRVVRRHATAVRACHEIADRRALPGAHPPLAFTIGPDGRVSAVEIDDAAVGGRAAATCLRREIATWVFPAPPGGGSIHVRYPLAGHVGASPAPPSTRRSARRGSSAP